MLLLYGSEANWIVARLPQIVAKMTQLDRYIETTFRLGIRFLIYKRKWKGICNRLNNFRL